MSAFVPRSNKLPALKLEAEPRDRRGRGSCRRMRRPHAHSTARRGGLSPAAYLWMKFFFSRYSMADEICVAMYSSTTAFTSCRLHSLR